MFLFLQVRPAHWCIKFLINEMWVRLWNLNLYPLLSPLCLFYLVHNLFVLVKCLTYLHIHTCICAFICVKVIFSFLFIFVCNIPFAHYFFICISLSTFYAAIFWSNCRMWLFFYLLCYLMTAMDFSDSVLAFLYISSLIFSSFLSFSNKYKVASILPINQVKKLPSCFYKMDNIFVVHI